MIAYTAKISNLDERDLNGITLKAGSIDLSSLKKIPVLLEFNHENPIGYAENFIEDNGFLIAELLCTQKLDEHTRFGISFRIQSDAKDIRVGCEGDIIIGDGVDVFAVSIVERPADLGTGIQSVV